MFLRRAYDPVSPDGADHFSVGSERLYRLNTLADGQMPDGRHLDGAGLLGA